MAGTITHRWNGTTLIVTSDSGTSACDLKGAQGNMGVRGPQGPVGVITNPSGTIIAEADNYYTKVEVDDAISAAKREAFDKTDALAADVAMDFINTESAIDAHNKRITNLEHRLEPTDFMEDPTIAYNKTAPLGALAYAEANRVGGMSYKTKNLINYPYNFGNSTTQSGITVTANSDGSLTINGTTTAYCWIVCSHIDTEVGKQYTARAYNCPSTLSMYMFYSNSDTTYFRDSATTITANQRSYTIVLAANAGYTYNNVRIYPMINEGSTVLPYEQHFDGIRDTKITEFKSTSANLAKPRKDLEVWGCNITSIDDAGKYTLTSTNSYNAIYARIARVTLFAGVTYTLSLTNVTGSLANLVVWAAGTTRIIIDTANRSATITPLVTAEYDIAVYMASGYSISVGSTASFYLMLNKGASALAYEPYKESVTPIPAAVQELEGYGLGANATYYNYLDWQPDKYIKNWHTKVKKIVFDGTENWSASATEYGNYRFRMVLNPTPLFIDIGYATPMVCSHYNAVTAANTWQDVNGVSIHNNEIMIKDSNYSTNVAWKAYLAEQYAAGTPVTLVYAIATPTVTDVTEIVPDDNFIRVYGGGTVTAVNEYKQAAPTIITYQLDGGAQ